MAVLGLIEGHLTLPSLSLKAIFSLFLSNIGVMSLIGARAYQQRPYIFEYFTFWPSNKSSEFSSNGP